MMPACVQASLPARFGVVKWVDFKSNKNWQAAHVPRVAELRTLKQKRTSKMRPRPVASWCLATDLPDANPARPIPAVVRWRNAFEGPDGPRSPTSRLVLYALAARMDADGSKCFPSQEMLAAITRLSARCIWEQLKLLQAERWIDVTQANWGGARWRHNIYTPTVPTFEHGAVSAFERACRAADA